MKLALLLAVLSQQGTLEQYVRDLESFGTRFIGADNHAQVTEHVKKVFRSLGYDPEAHRFTFRQPSWRNGDWSTYEGRTFENVVATLPGRDRTLPPLILSAHYDSINWNDAPNSIRDPNARAPGADDSGSAMAVLFEVARRLQGKTFERDIRFVAFDAEEQGLGGSERYVEDLNRRGGKILAVVNYDMIGLGDKLELEVPKESEWLLKRFEEAAKGLDLDVRFRVGPPRAEYMQKGALRGSDHTHFIRTGHDAIAGLEATLDPEIWNRNYNPNYHRHSDRVDTLNFKQIEKVATLTERALADLAGTPRMDRARGAVRAEVVGAGQFAAAYVLKEAMNGRVSVDHLAEPVFWRDLAAFTVASRVVEKLPVRGIARAALPLAAGMAAVQLMHGQASWRDVAIDTASFLAAGAAVSLIADGLIYPALFAAGPPGWIAAGAYTVAKMTVTLYAGEKLGGWLRGMLFRDMGRGTSDVGREGVTQKLERVGE
jgi:hypothetical protein